MLRDALAPLGFLHFVATADECTTGPRRLGLAIASRVPIQRQSLISNPVWPERILRVDGRFGTILTTYIPPGSSNGFRKVEMLEASFDEFRHASSGPAILAGDFNSPQEESPELVTWGQRQRRNGQWTVIPSRGARWDKAERRFFDGTLVDAFRHLHPEVEASSWTLRRGDRLIPRRFDHLFCSAHWNPVSAWYEELDKSLSDHRPLVVDLERGV